MRHAWSCFRSPRSSLPSLVLTLALVGLVAACDTDTLPVGPPDGAEVTSSQQGTPASGVVSTHWGVYTIPPGDPRAGAEDADQIGEAWIERDEGKARLRLWTDPGTLPAREAFTVWAVIFNDPSACETQEEDIPQAEASGCGAADIVAAGGDVVRFAKAVSKIDGSLHVGSSILQVGDVSHSVLPENLQNGLTNPLGAEIHVIGVTHGDFPNPGVDQFANPGAGCNPDCGDVFVSIHLPPGS